MDLSRWVQELRRRRVFRVVVGYGIATFAILQVVEPVMHGLHLPEWILSLVVVALGLGFPVAVVLAWAFDLRSTGIERTPPSSSPGPRGSPLTLVLVGLGAAAAAPSLLYYFLWRGGSERSHLVLALLALGAGVGTVALLLRTRPGRAAEAGAGAADRSTAVLPFADLSPSKDQDYFCDGIADELLNALCGVAGLRVAARSSSFQFKGRAVDSREVSRLLGVSTLLEGSVRKSGNRVRVTAQLVNGADGYQLWSEAFDRALDDIFAIQEEIARAVVRALKLSFSSPAGTRFRRAGTHNLQAYEMYLKGRQFLMSISEAGNQFAVQMFRGAIELDAGFGLAHCGLADTCFMLLQWHLDEGHAGELRAEGLAASEEALRLDPDLAEAHVSRANMLSLVGRAEEAERDFRRALSMNPALPDSWYFYARHLYAAGRHDEAARAFEETARRNPDDYSALCLLVSLHHGREQAAQAASAASRALSAVERRLRLNPDDARALYMGGCVDVLLGDRARGLARLARALELRPNDFATLYNVACGYAHAGEYDRSLDILDRAVATGRGFRTWMERDGDLDPLRGYPRFREILDRVKA
ncbi:MAG TPA: tetratricopeptide repeat protein [Anaeromyxobacteraceae bacterium]|nr:tetratricopeptide repeat protein [Anaeromyxobacteraceae bacterium]